ncbi:hypothetical protein CIHG_06237 [Coccidioides immitis H538.4]|uniref:Uncharacterized protein n=3 Tax=Coccidioides immitis TaxID=5501 RepID=A0A0J8TNI9_COCIT|nr:hypothetical protein CIRG_09514 [Coccidioides immitis RMSCC 2394]KMU75282.1 hypothetical protein CISG_04701 [Coccidioides immitis RMSCC 3703]KMU88437.1 hypothetical protein CIHG_06237 [Coccidioides immitis H538.4]
MKQPLSSKNQAHQCAVQAKHLGLTFPTIPASCQLRLAVPGPLSTGPINISPSRCPKADRAYYSASLTPFCADSSSEFDSLAKGKDGKGRKPQQSSPRQIQCPSDITFGHWKNL